VLRYRPPFPRLARRTATEVELGGYVIAANQIILLWIASANRDATQFPRPDRFDISRVPNQHLTFGHGIHFCIGAPLARLEAKLALGLLLERYREVAVARDEASSSTTRGRCSAPSGCRWTSWRLPERSVATHVAQWFGVFKAARRGFAMDTNGTGVLPMYESFILEDCPQSGDVS